MQRVPSASVNAAASMTAPIGSVLPAHSLFLTGPTASGKTIVAIELAQRLGAEIISIDSMAVYRQMDIGTAKPSFDQRRRIPHHLIDLVDPWEEFSLADFLRSAADAVVQVALRGRVPLFVGGTPLYLKALLRGAEGGPPPNPSLRSQLEHHAATQGVKALFEQLERVDPTAARRIHPNDVRRIIRALEVFAATGAPISAHQVHFHDSVNANAQVVCLDVPRPELYRRINERVVNMFQHGLVAEVRSLMELPHMLSRTARQAVGYKEVIAHLEGQYSLAKTTELVQRRSRQFAKRQLTWFRSIPECRRLPVQSSDDLKTIAETLFLFFSTAHHHGPFPQETEVK
jgi:tRNA dimethylallyltransferase